jgi:hypothetical protein
VSFEVISTVKELLGSSRTSCACTDFTAGMFCATSGATINSKDSNICWTAIGNGGSVGAAKPTDGVDVVVCCIVAGVAVPTAAIEGPS